MALGSISHYISLWRNGTEARWRPRESGPTTPPCSYKSARAAARLLKCIRNQQQPSEKSKLHRLQPCLRSAVKGRTRLRRQAKADGGLSSVGSSHMLIVSVIDSRILGEPGCSCVVIQITKNVIMRDHFIVSPAESDDHYFNDHHFLHHTQIFVLFSWGPNVITQTYTLACLFVL